MESRAKTWGKVSCDAAESHLSHCRAPHMGSRNSDAAPTSRGWVWSMDTQFILFPAVNLVAQILWLDSLGGGGISCAIA